MTIELGDVNDYKNKSNVLIDNTSNFFWYYKYYRPQYRIDILKNQILLNLPKVIDNVNDLQIYIRSGDIFANTSSPLGDYTSTPFIFLQKYSK